MNRRSGLSTVVAAFLVVLSTSPFTAPFSTCDVRDLTHHPADLTHPQVADDGSLPKSKGLDLLVAGGSDTVLMSLEPSRPEQSRLHAAVATGIHHERHRELRL